MRIKTKIPQSILNLDKRIKVGIKLGLQKSSVALAGVPNTTDGGLIKKEMNQPKSGRTYKVIVKNKRKYLNHIASNASGLESSAVLSGRLAKSVRGKTLGSTRLEISANTPYAGIQEKGGMNSQNSLIAPRNNLIRPITKSRGNIMNNIRQGISSITK
jgi:phage gpG-like protein